MSPRLLSLALTASDRLSLFVDGAIRYLPWDYRPPRRRRRRACLPAYGRVKSVAERMVDGEISGTYGEVAAAEGVDADSLKAAVWRVRNRRAGRRGRAAA